MSRSSQSSWSKNGWERTMPLSLLFSGMGSSLWVVLGMISPFVTLTIPSCAGSESPGAFYVEMREGASAGDLAAAIGEHFEVSVLIQGQASEAPVSGVVRSAGLEEALQVLAFLSGSEYTGLEGAGIYLYGNDGAEGVEFAAGVAVRDAAVGSFGGNVQQFGDGFIVSGSDREREQAKKVLQAAGDRSALEVEVWLVESTGNTIEDTRLWLDTFRVEAGARKGSAQQVVDAAATVASSGWFTGLDALAVFDFVERRAGAELVLSQSATILSGSVTSFESGIVDEDEIFERQPEVDRSLTSAINRRTVGLILDLAAYEIGSGLWRVEIDLQDNSIEGLTESRTAVSSEAIIEARPGLQYEIASFARERDETRQLSIPVLSGIPFVGGMFERDVKRHQVREVKVILSVSDRRNR